MYICTNLIRFFILHAQKASSERTTQITNKLTSIPVSEQTVKCEMAFSAICQQFLFSFS